jgi:hypothetical protein
MVKPRENPFAAYAVDRIEYKFAAGEMQKLMEALRANNWRGAIVGPHGTGKSTLVRTITPQLPAGASIVDGAEKIPSWKWPFVRHGFRKATAVLITTHAPGRLPTVFRTSTTPQLLAELIEQLSGRAARPEFVRQLFDRHNGNIRDALREMYDRCGADDFSWA